MLSAFLGSPKIWRFSVFPYLNYVSFLFYCPHHAQQHEYCGELVSSFVARRVILVKISANFLRLITEYLV
jgi:hypothetical protein